MKPIAATPSAAKKSRRPRSAAGKLGSATARRKAMTPEEFEVAAAKLGPKGQELLAMFDRWEKKHPGYGEWAWPRLQAAMDRSNGRTRKIFAD